MSLIEILTAAALLSFLLIPVVNLILGSSRNIRRGAVHTQAVFVAQSQVEELLVAPFEDLLSIPEQNVLGKPFRARVEVAPFEGQADVKRISVVVSWKDRSTAHRRSLRLDCLRSREGHR